MIQIVPSLSSRLRSLKNSKLKTKRHLRKLSRSYLLTNRIAPSLKRNLPSRLRLKREPSRRLLPNPRRSHHLRRKNLQKKNPKRLSNLNLQFKKLLSARKRPRKSLLQKKNLQKNSQRRLSKENHLLRSLLSKRRRPRNPLHPRNLNPKKSLRRL